MNKKSQKLCFFIKLFFQSYLFSFLLRKKRAESPESQPYEPDFFPDAVGFWAAQIFAADHVQCKESRDSANGIRAGGRKNENGELGTSGE